MPGLYGVVVETEFLQAAGSEVFNQDIGTPDQLSKGVGTDRRLQIQRYALFASIHAEEKRTDIPRERCPSAGVVAVGRFFNLDNLGTHIAQQHGAIGARQDPCEIDDADSTKGWHVGGRLYRWLSAGGLL